MATDNRISIQKVNILGVPFSTLSFEETLRILTENLSGGERPLHIITANPEIVMMARTNDTIRTLLHEADLVTPDGIGAVWASQYYGHKLRDRVTGMELSGGLIEYAAAHNLSVYLLGATPPSNSKAVENLRTKYPHLRITGHHGYFQSDEEPYIAEHVRTFKPDLLLVGLGMPRQELFIQTYKEQIGAKVLIGIGGVIDIFAGTVKRAPRIWQKARLEWLYRLLSQPSRWRRQLVLPQFVMTVLRDPHKKRV
ncbi:MAG TPA: WecB/TagA/CpsF family glycosyltransferase [Bacilli bacterium]|nr:WecB/TagA/CpsF family glycosyltransferase [Bacilli bacterium]